MEMQAVRAAEHACTALVQRYARLVDFGPAVDAVDLFTADATLVHHTGDVFTGHDTLRDLFLAKDDGPRVTVHTMSNILIDVHDESTAAGTVVWTLYDANREATASADGTGGPMPLDGPAMVGTYQDDFVCADGEWRFVSRRISAVFRRDQT